MTALRTEKLCGQADDVKGHDRLANTIRATLVTWLDAA